MYKKNNIIFYLFLSAAALYIAVLTFFRPLSMDDFFYANASSGGILEIFKFYYKHYLTWGPRIGTLFDMFFLSAGKTIFIVLNTAVQIGLVFCMHYVVTGRKINVCEKKDVILFIILTLLLLFNPVGGQTLFWISAVANYSFTALIFFVMLFFLRAVLAGRQIIENNIFSCIFLFITGFVIGMSNENTAPLACLIIIFSLIYLKFKKMPVPKWIYWLLTGTFAGTVALLAAPGSYKRMTAVTDFSMTDIFVKLHLQETAENFLNTPMLFKIKFIPLRIGKFIFLSAGIPVFIVIVSMYAFVKQNFKQEHKKNIVFAVVFLFLALISVSVLCFAPKPSIRAYYAPLLMTFVSFGFILLYITDNFSKKKVSYFILGCGLIISSVLAFNIIPSFYYLHKIENQNLVIIEEALQTPQKNAEIYRYEVPFSQYHAILNPSENKEFHVNVEMSKYYGLSSIVVKKQ